MTSPTEKLLARIRDLQGELEAEFHRRRAEFSYRLENGRVVFETEIRRRHRALRVGLGTFLRQTRPMVVLTAPVIYSLILPFALLDLFATLYQAVCFPVYRIEKVRRADFRTGAMHAYYAQFVDYGDAEGFGPGLSAARTRITRPGLSGIDPDT